MMTTPIVSVKNIRKTYGKAGEKQYEALKGIDFDVQPGEFVGIMGASGSGKTTLLNILATLDRPTSGTVTVNQRELTTLAGNQMADFRATQVGFIFQDFNLLENLTNYENIALPLSLQNVSAKAAEPEVNRIAKQLSIEAILDKYPSEISGGQKQRIAAARALVSHPAILFGDEPTGALDSNSAKDLLEMLTTVNQEQHVPVLLVTHDPFSASYCQRILFIKDGVIGTELKRGNQDRRAFYQTILDTLGTFQ
ncbi:ATP-binding cassette domain-containing protein [Secundilactobacillus kimchicus]|uniref:Abc transporter, atp-binding protein n=1 Tax=Secundilactobacillus kimchicus JCM 15530 TaxID=1302272 RepID=A0A0R1HNL6_9LACO|nr:ABC transporter ATP-binding protein [Secundilactobacillus kimchicus]KRK48240.1 abc transporter, atp-binding protein [Secundilactobacillus kimchicus JCM 15530]MBT9670799.1 ATP-binding cassette domain-containing protein [Secundilactobacillus kimchicus]